MRATCSEEHCISAAEKAGMCQRHWKRLYRTGTTDLKIKPPRPRFIMPPTTRAARALSSAAAWECARQELERGCTACGRTWREHFRRNGEPRGCR